MWQRFTENARKAVFAAQEEAQRLNEGYVSTEHLLLGLVKSHGDDLKDLFNYLNVSTTRIRAEIEKALPRNEARSTQDMSLTPRAKRAIDLAYDEVRAMNASYLNDTHLFLGLIREGDGLAGRVLAKLGIELEKCRRFVEQQVKEKSGVEITKETVSSVIHESQEPVQDAPTENVKKPKRNVKEVVEFAEVIIGQTGSKEKSLELLREAKLQAIEAVVKVFDDLEEKVKQGK